MKVKDIVCDLEEIAPPGLADDGDKIGLQVGDPDATVTKILVALDPAPATIEHAIDEDAELIVCHHPLIYSPLLTLASGEPTRDSIIKLITAGTALYVMHTNYDAVAGGVNDVLARRLGVNVTGILTTRRRERKFKVVVFTPEEAVSEVRDAMAEAGAGVIGNYTRCSFRAQGAGTFIPISGAQPYIGEIGRLEEATEYRLEMIVPEWRLQHVLDAMIARHPYEEVAYDIYALENEPNAYGYGRVGRLNAPMKLGEFRRFVEDSLQSHETRMTGNPDTLVEFVAVCGGGGRKLIEDAKKAGADVYVTGDVGYHDLLAADGLGIAVIDAGHYETELPGMEALADRLSRLCADKGVKVEILH